MKAKKKPRKSQHVRSALGIQRSLRSASRNIKRMTVNK